MGNSLSARAAAERPGAAAVGRRAAVAAETAPVEGEHAPATRPARRLTRRRFLLGAGGLLAGLGGGAAYARYVEPYWPTWQRLTMDLPGLGAGLVGARLVQLSDLHVAPVMPMDYLRRHLGHVVASGPDLIVLTGDYVTRAIVRDADALRELLAELRAPLGVFAVLGNHDYGVHEPRRGPVVGSWPNHVARIVADAGVTVLRNEVCRIERGGAALQLVGLDDLWSGRCDPQAAFASVNQDEPCIALAHNPDTFPLLRDRPCRWVLSGHTHGGQVRVPLLGPVVLPVRDKTHDAGLFAVGSQQLYVNRGLGYLLPVRFNCRPEITEFTLTAG